MPKVSWKPGTQIYPLPAVLVTCGNAERSNMLTVAWTGTICTNPPMCYISVRPERYSHALIKERMVSAHRRVAAEHRVQGQGDYEPRQP